MLKQRKIYVIGHKNPDTDSICSAIAYADIKNRSDKGRYVAKRAGQLNEETEYVLNYFHVAPPAYLGDVGTQVKDMEIRETPGVSSDISLKDAWSIMKESNAVTLPIIEEDGSLEGLITTGDIAKSYMDVHDNAFLSRARTKFRSIAQTVDGTVIVGNEHGYFMKGKVYIGAANPQRMEAYLEEDDLVILADRQEDHIRAIQQGVSCIIITVGSELSEEARRLAEEKQCVVIATPLDTFTVARLINQSIPVKYVMKKKDLITFCTEDFTDSIKDIMATTRHRAFPVLNKKGKYVGTVSRRNLLGMKKKQLILVDHNEKSQAVDNVEAAEILEIVDHHRLKPLETIQPVYFRNQPVGCTASIMYEMYQERRLTIPTEIAGILCAAIISDTLMFRSPTCTQADRNAAGALAAIAGIHNIEEFSMKMFQAGSNLHNKGIEEIFYQDFKKFSAEDTSFGVGQISSMSTEELLEVKERLIPFMKNESGKKGIPMMFFMLTNIMEESTELLCCGDNSERLVEDAFSVEKEEDVYHLQGVVSRKKQLIPAFMSALQQI
ncbi:MAG: putative manganese-dependent inorganic diphosphatase [Lachnospiraceae bacterium]|jgi:manganese-dependent inorganic pyrophosphatase